MDTFHETLTFILHDFLWSDIVPGIKPVKLSNVDMLVKLGIWRNGSQGIAKKTFFWNPSSIILLEIRDTFLSLLQPWHDCARLILHNNDIHKNLNCTFYKKLVYQDTISWNWVALTVSRKHYLTSVTSDLIVSLRNKVYNVTYCLMSTEPWSQQSKVEN